MTSEISRWRRTDDEPPRIDDGVHVRFNIRTFRTEKPVTGPRNMTRGVTIDELLGDDWTPEGDE